MEVFPANSKKMEKDEIHVLAVDDNLLDRKLVERLLTNSSFKVTTAESGMKALEYLGLVDDHQSSKDGHHEEVKVDLIITDYSMTGMTGYELLKKIKLSTMKDIPVVILSSEDIPSRINECLEEGAEMFLLKPLNKSDVKRLMSIDGINQ